VAFGAGVCHGAATPKPLPPFDKVQEAVGGMLAEQPDYRPGDILSRSQVESLLEQLATLGFAVPDRAEVLSLVPDDSDPLVVMLRTPDGEKFIRRIAAQPKKAAYLLRRTDLIRTVSTGLCWNLGMFSTATLSILSSTSKPEVTRPNTQ